MITIKARTSAFKQGMGKLARRQIPYASAKALTDTAWQIKTDEEKGLKEHLDRPTPFTQKGIGVKKATKSTLEARVFIRDNRSKYLKWVVDGGTKHPHGRYIAAPSQIRLNKYGNIAGKTKRIKSMLSNDDKFFSGQPRGVGKNTSRGTGIFRRIGKGKRSRLKMEVSYIKKAEAKAIFPFYGIADDRVSKSFMKNMTKAMRIAIDTAR